MATQLDRLSGLKFAPRDYQTHWEGLQDMPVEALCGAVSRAARACEAFPSPAELREFADAILNRAQPRSHVQMETLGDEGVYQVTLPNPFGGDGLTITVDRHWKYYCERCSDQGQETLQCGSPVRPKPWLDRLHCGRDYEHDPHEWARRCVCWSSNPAVLKRRESQTQYAAQKAERRAS